MKIRTLDLLPPQTRILLNEKMRRKIFSDKKQIAEILEISIKTVNNWIRGDFRPSIEQLQNIGIDLDSEDFFENIEEIGLERSKFNFTLPKELDLSNVSWLIGVMEGDRAGEIENGIGLTNENEGLIREFIEGMKIFNVANKDFRLKIQITKGKQINKEEFSDKFEIPVNRISVSESEVPRKHPVIQILLTNKIFAKIFQKLSKIILDDLSEISPEIRSKFVKGFCDAEGSVNIKKSTIEIKQKNIGEGNKRLTLVSKMLTSLNVQNKINGPNCEDMLTIRLAGGKRNIENLRKFGKLIGFSHLEKQEKLNKITMLSAGHMA